MTRPGRPNPHDGPPGRATAASTSTARQRGTATVLIVLLAPLGLSLMAVSAVNVTLPIIAARLGAGSADLQWVLSGYALAYGVTLVPAGRAGDVLGRGRVFVAGTAVFLLGSLACGLAPTPMLLNAARVLQGVGAGIFNPQIPGMIQQHFTGAARARAFALFGMVISVAIAIGPLVAGGIIDWLGPDRGWRGAFLAYLPLGLVVLALCPAWLPREPRPGRNAASGSAVMASRRGPRIDADAVGTLLLAATVLAVMVPFMVRTGPVWVLLLAVPVLAAGWLGWERRYAARGRDPMVDPGLFAIGSFGYGTLVAGTLLLGQTTTFVVLALYLQGHLGASALQTGLVGLPNAIAAAVAALWAGRHVIARGREVVVGGLVAALLGTGATMAVAGAVERGASLAWLALPLLLNGLGMGAINPPNQMLSLADVSLGRVSTAAGAKYTVERIGTAIGATSVTGVYFAVLAAYGDTGVDTRVGAGQGTGSLAAFQAGYAVIAAYTLLSLAIAAADLRRHRAGRSRSAARWRRARRAD